MTLQSSYLRKVHETRGICTRYELSHLSLILSSVNFICCYRILIVGSGFNLVYLFLLVMPVSYFSSFIPWVTSSGFTYAAHSSYLALVFLIPSSLNVLASLSPCSLWGHDTWVRLKLGLGLLFCYESFHDEKKMNG